MEAKLQAWLYEMYTDKNLVKLDYETAETEEDGAIKRENVVPAREAQPVSTQEKQEEPQLKHEVQYGKLEIEGIEEITGNYTPE